VRGWSLAPLLLVLAPSVLAQDLPKTIKGDLDGDGVPDTVDLKASDQDPDSIDVTVALSASKRTVQAAGFTRGQSINAAEIAKGELHLGFGWYQGRYKWASDFHIGLQGPDLIVRRYEFNFVDSIEADAQGHPKTEGCAADFVAGRAVRNGKPAKPPGPPVRLDKWSEASVPDACRF
jgi:hypothetical protein